MHGSLGGLDDYTHKRHHWLRTENLSRGPWLEVYRQQCCRLLGLLALVKVFDQHDAGFRNLSFTVEN